MYSQEHNLENLRIDLLEMKFPRKLDDMTKIDYSHIIKILHFSFFSYSKLITQFLEINKYAKKLKYQDKEFIEFSFEVLQNLFNYRPKISINQMFTYLFQEEKINFCSDVIKLIRMKNDELSKIPSLKQKKEEIVQESTNCTDKNCQISQESQNPFSINNTEIITALKDLTKHVDFLSRSFQSFQFKINERITKIEDELKQLRKTDVKKSADSEVECDHGYAFSFADNNDINNENMNNNIDSGYGSIKNERKNPIIILNKDSRGKFSKNADELIDRVSNKFKETQKLLNEMNMSN
jgi:hypothetical protein